MRTTVGVLVLSSTLACSAEGGGAGSSAPSTSARSSATPTSSTVASSKSSASSATSSAPTPTAETLDDAAVKALALSPDGESALRVLAGAPHFGGWAVGAAGSPTPVVEALRTIVKEKSAVKALELVLDKGTLDGRVMALAGLWDLDQDAFKRGLAKVKDTKGSVRLMTSGCAPGGDPVPLATVLERSDAVRLEGPKDDLSAWSTRNPKKPIELDVVGGGYTAVMRAR